MWPNSQETVDLVTFTEEILNGKLHILCSVNWETRLIRSLRRLTETVMEEPNNLLWITEENLHFKSLIVQESYN